MPAIHSEVSSSSIRPVALPRPISAFLIQVLVVDLYIPETLVVMTTAAVGAELAFMDIVLPVAGVALCG